LFEKINIENILFLDIETVPEYESWEELSDEKKDLFDSKTKYLRKDEFSPEEYYVKAGIWAEFGKIICISVGYFVKSKTEFNFRVTSFYEGNEKNILIDFKNLLNTHFNKNINKYIRCPFS